MSVEARRQINFSVPPVVYGALAKRASAMGMPTGTYARLLFEAAYAARIGREKGNPTSDEELDAAVRAVFCMAGQFSAAEIAHALGVSETFVERVIKCWRMVGRGKA